MAVAVAYSRVIGDDDGARAWAARAAACAERALGASHEEYTRLLREAGEDVEAEDPQSELLSALENFMPEELFQALESASA